MTDFTRTASARPWTRHGGRLIAIIGWIVSLAGTALWLYGYFANGNRSLIDWHAHTPWWVADILPNVESEIGMVLAFAGMLPIYWPLIGSRVDQINKPKAKPE